LREVIETLTYQDYIEAMDQGSVVEFARRAITEHKSSRSYRDALVADLYDARRNKTINDFVRFLFAADGHKIKDETVANMHLASNFFNQLNMRRCVYSLGNGLTFQAEGVYEKLGAKADRIIKDAGYYGLIHGVSFLYWAFDHIHMFKLTEFVPLWDEDTGNLGAGVRFWQLDERKPLRATLYTPDGYIDLRAKEGNISGLELMDGSAAPNPYRTEVRITPATGDEVETAHNYSSLPVVPLWGSRLHQSTIIGMRDQIDAYDIVSSGYANDLQDCPQIYWIINNAGGMKDKDLSAFRERLLHRHIATVNNSDGISVEPYTQEIPVTARESLLDRLKTQIYEDFGVLDTTSISAAAKTATEINAAYQPMDENADDFEYQIIEAVQNLLALQGIGPEDATPQFKRNRISNQLEQVQIVMMEAQYLDDETVLNKLPNISPEEVEEIMRKKEAEELDRVTGPEPPEDEDGPEEKDKA